MVTDVEYSTLIAYIGPGIAEALATAGTALGMSEAIASGIPTISEDPAYRGRVFALAMLPMSQTLLYGFVYMFLSYNLILPQILAKYQTIPPHIAGAIFGISLVVGFAEMFSAWMQGRVCGYVASQLIKTRGGIFSSGIILAAYEELIGILGMVFGLLVSFALM